MQRQTIIGHIELEDGVTGGQGHFVDLGHIPCRHNHSTRVGIVFQLIEHILYLVDGTTIIIGPRTPLVTINWTKLAILVGPLVPDANAMVLQIFYVGVALKKPQQLVDDTFKVELLGGEQGETIVEIIATLGTKDADGACTGAVALLGAFGKDAVQDV